MLNFYLYYFRFFSILISILCFLNILYSYYFDLYLNVNSYFYTLLISIIPLISFFFKKKDAKINIYSKIITVILGYITLPILISFPYFLSIYNISFLDSYFEAVSGFTSTGFTVFNNIKHLDESLILWRSSSQWIGGLYFLFSIILLIDIFDDNLKKTLTNFLAFNSAEIFKQSLKIFLIYSIFTLLIFITLNIFEFRSFISLNLSMSIISSGGFLPVNNLDILLNSQTKIIVFSTLMLSSFFSLFFFYNLLYKKKGIKFIQEDIYLIIYLLITIFFFFLLTDKSVNFAIIYLSITSSISNIGVSLNNIPNYLSFVFLILIIIGGSFFSTSSGIRFLKLLSLFKFSLKEIISNAKPKNVFANKLWFSDKIMVTTDFYKYFFSIIIFILSLIALSSILSIFNLSMENSFKLSILTLMNTVNSSMTGLALFDFKGLPIFAKQCLITFMIIGRVELISILIILKKFLFKN